METFLFNRVVFGPVKSRRLGVSLGINLLPCSRKLCNFNCVYCECGGTPPPRPGGDESILPAREEVRFSLMSKLQEMKVNSHEPEVITFAGNGEPTLHPEFHLIMDDSIALRNIYFPDAKIAVLSNATTLTSPAIRNALLKADMPILKIDSAIDETIISHNQPHVKISAEELISNLASFNGRIITQTLFLRGSYRGRVIDNTTPVEIEAWLKALTRIQPKEAMIYTIARGTPEGGTLVKISEEELRRFAEMAEKAGIKTQVSA